jgi:multidrug efflux pump subunit AcrA (membrane-fusion protein)
VVGRSTVTEIVDVPASVTARAAATLTAPATGTLAKLTVAAGATVRKGSVVAVIDSPAAQQRLADAKAALAAAGNISADTSVQLVGVQSGLDAAEQDALDAARAAANQITDPKQKAALLAQIDAAQARYEAAARNARQVVAQVENGLASVGDAVDALGAAQQAQAKTAYDLAKSDVDALTLRAPISGVVQFSGPSGAAGSDAIEQLLSSAGGGAAAAAAPSGSSAGGQNLAGIDDVMAVGDPVSAGTAIVTIVDTSEIGLVGSVDETDVLLVAPGVSADVELDAAPGQTYQATVRTIDVLPTESAQGGVAYRIRLNFTDSTQANGGTAPPTPRPGMSAVAHLKVRTATNAVAVPASAVFSSDSGNAVWLVGADGRAVQQRVTVGVQGEDEVAITAGLQPGQRVVVTGADKVNAGDSLS